MSYTCKINIGQTVANQELYDEFKCSNMKGMSSMVTNSQFLVSDLTYDLYKDKWIGDILHYTGMGKVWGQDI